MTKHMSIENKFWEKVIVPADKDSCWLWTGAKDHPSGYGRFWFKNRLDLAHRASYELNNVCIPVGLVIDHLCRNTACVNPSHLEAVTQRANILRGTGEAARNSVKTQCPQGHPYDDTNTYTDPRGKRQCRICRSKRDAARH